MCIAHSYHSMAFMPQHMEKSVSKQPKQKGVKNTLYVQQTD